MQPETFSYLAVPFQALADAPLGMALFKLPDLTLLWCNEVFSNILEGVTGGRSHDGLEALFSDDQIVRAVEAMERCSPATSVSGVQEVQQGGRTQHWKKELIPVPGDREHPPCFLVLLTEVTERRRVERDPRNSESKYRGLFESTQEYVSVYRYELDANNEVVNWVLEDANPHALKFFGASSLKEIQGKRVDELFGPHILAKRLPLIRALRASGSPVTYEARYERDGRDYIATFAPLDQDYIMHTALDVTGIKRAQRAAEDERARLQAVLGVLPIGIMVTDAEGRIVMMNESLRNIVVTGQESGREGIGETSTSARIGKEHVLWASLSQALCSGEPQLDKVLSTNRPDGAPAIIVVSVVPIKGSKEETTGAVLAVQDITEDQRMEDALRESEERFRHLIEQAPVAIGMSRDGQTIYANRRYLDMFGFRAVEELVGRSYLEQIAPELHEGLIEKVQRDIEKGITSFEIDLIGLRKDNSTFPFHAAITTLNLANGPALLGFFTDITERKRAEEELRRSNTELQQFAYVASHDLKEPLRMVSNYLQLLDRRHGGSLDTRGKEYIDIAVEGSRRMSRLIDDLLAFSRVGTAGKALSPTDMEAVLEEALGNLGVRIVESGAVVRHGSLPWVKADANQMVQLLQNLIDNAIKYRSERPLVIQVSSRRTGNEWLFSVQDNGIGIPKGQQERIFQMFQRLHTRDEYEGTGIGLAIAKKIVERHGGHIWVESEEGKGSTFCFTLPYHALSPDRPSL